MAKTPESGPQHDDGTREARNQVQVALLWGETVLDVQHLSGPGRMSVGREAGSDFRVDTPAIGDGFELVDWRGSECEVVVPPGARLLVGADGGALEESLAPVRRIAIAVGQRARIVLGGLAFEVRWALAPKQHGVAGPRDYRFARIATISSMTAVAVFAAIFVTDVKAEVLSEDVSRSPVFVPTFVRPKPPERFVNLPKPVVTSREEPSSAVPRKFGEATKDTRRANENLIKTMVSSVFDGSGAVGNVFGPGGGIGHDLNTALGALGETAVVDSGGLGGLGSRSLGPGGGPNTLGIGGVGTRSGAPGGSRDFGVTIGNGRRKIDVKVDPITHVIGGCERSVIAKVIAANAGQVRYCYSMELGRDSTMEGKVAVSFTIGTEGAVTEASLVQSTLGNEGVEKCILSRIRNWKFAPPTGGGICVINYPWVFKAAGGGED